MPPPPPPAFDVRPACKGRINNFQLHKNFRQYVAELEYTIYVHCTVVRHKTNYSLNALG